MLVQQGAGDDSTHKFTKKVTLINHTQDKNVTFDLQHGGKPVQMQTTLEHIVLADAYRADLPSSQAWTYQSLRLMIENAVNSWAVQGQWAFQWATFRIHPELDRASVLIRATPQARTFLLRHSGKALVYTRERSPSGSSPEDYTVVWLQSGARPGNPVAIVTAAASGLQNHYGICRNARGFGLRTPPNEVAAIRKVLRPQDKTLNSTNQDLIPSSTWVLRGILARATAAEVSEAICPVWPILPVRQLSIRNDRAVWLVSAASEPPSDTLTTSEQVILIEKAKQDRQSDAKSKQKTRPQGENRKRSQSARTGRAAATPFKAGKQMVGQDPLMKDDPWLPADDSEPRRRTQVGTSGNGSGSASSSSDASVLNRLKKAEDAIVRIEHRQTETDKQLVGMQSFMSDRFAEVMSGLASLTNQPRKKGRSESEGRGGQAVETIRLDDSSDDEHDMVASLSEQEARGGEALSTFVSANVTSLPKRWTEIADLQGDVICLTETLAHSADHEWLQAAFRSKSRVFSPGASCLVTGQLSARQAGVALLASTDFSVCSLPREGILEELYVQARLHYVSLSHCASRYPIRVLIYYGKAGRYSENASELTQILDLLGQHPDVPTMVTGDLNLPDWHAFWQGFATQEVWVDAHYNAGTQEAPQATCYPNWGDPSRIDYTLLNAHLANSLKTATVLRGCTFPVHLPLAVQIDLDLEPVEVLRTPLQFPRRKASVCPSFDGFVEHQAVFEEYLNQDMFSQAYQLWSAYWEAWLSRATLDVPLEPRYQGRGATLSVRKVPPRTPRKMAMSETEAYLRNLLGRVREARRLQHLDTGYGRALMGKIVSQISQVMRRYGTPPQAPTPAEEDYLETLDAFLESLLQKERLECQKRRKAQWQNKLHSGNGLNRTLSQAVRNSGDLVVRSLRSEAGGLSGRVQNIQDIFRALTQHWDTIHQLPEVGVQQWCDEYLRFVPNVPTEDPQCILASDITAMLARMSVHSSRGPDSWSVGELRDLPEIAMVQIAMLFAHCEAKSAWPDIFCVVHTSLIQKVSDPGPSQVRPIGVTAVLYRTWSALRFRGLQSWVEQVYPSGVTAYRAGYDSQVINAIRSDEIEKAVLEGREQHLVSFDLRKAFDHTPHKILEQICRRAGMPERILALILYRLRTQRQHWKIRGVLSGPRCMQRGVIQGCALSCMLFNLVMMPVLWQIRLDPLATPIQAHADDLLIQEQDTQAIQRSIALLMRYLQCVQIPLQPSKTQYLCVCPSGDGKVEVGDASIQMSPQIRVLGQSLCTRIPRCGTLSFAERSRKYLQRVANLKSLRLCSTVRLRMLQTMCTPVLTYSPLQICPLDIPGNLRSDTLDVLWPRLPGHRSAVLLFCFLTPAHVVDPVMSLVYNLIRAIRQVSQVLQGQTDRCLPSRYVRAGPVTLLLDTLEQLGIYTSQGFRVQDIEGRVHSLLPPAEPDRTKEWKHKWRVLVRAGFLRTVKDTRTSLKHMATEHDRLATRLLYQVMDCPHWAYHLALVIGGAQITQESRHRQDPNLSDVCPHCDSGLPESVEHRFWECPSWNSIRDLWTPPPRETLQDCFALHAIVPLQHGLTLEQIMRTQAMLCHISLEAASVDRSAHVEPNVHRPHPTMLTQWCRHPQARAYRPQVLETWPMAGIEPIICDPNQDAVFRRREMIGGHELALDDDGRRLSCQCPRMPWMWLEGFWRASEGFRSHLLHLGFGCSQNPIQTRPA